MPRDVSQQRQQQQQQHERQRSGEQLISKSSGAAKSTEAAEKTRATFLSKQTFRSAGAAISDNNNSNQQPNRNRTAQGAASAQELESLLAEKQQVQLTDRPEVSRCNLLAADSSLAHIDAPEDQQQQQQHQQQSESIILLNSQLKRTQQLNLQPAARVVAPQPTSNEPQIKIMKDQAEGRGRQQVASPSPSAKRSPKLQATVDSGKFSLLSSSAVAPSAGCSSSSSSSSSTSASNSTEISEVAANLPVGSVGSASPFESAPGTERQRSTSPPAPRQRAFAATQQSRGSVRHPLKRQQPAADEQPAGAAKTTDLDLDCEPLENKGAAGLQAISQLEFERVRSSQRTSAPKYPGAAAAVASSRLATKSISGQRHAQNSKISSRLVSNMNQQHASEKHQHFHDDPQATIKSCRKLDLLNQVAQVDCACSSCSKKRKLNAMSDPRYSHKDARHHHGNHSTYYMGDELSEDGFRYSYHQGSKYPKTTCMHMVLKTIIMFLCALVLLLLLVAILMASIHLPQSFDKVMNVSRSFNVTIAGRR